MSTYIDPDYKFPTIIKVLSKDPQFTVVEFEKNDFQPGDWITADKRYAPFYIIDSIDNNEITMHIDDINSYTEVWLTKGFQYMIVSRTVGEFDIQ